MVPSSFNRSLVSIFAFTLISTGFAQQCRSYNRQLGNCVSIKVCPPLLEVLKNSPTPVQLRQLQKLTCGFDSADPKVCCPMSDTLLPTPPQGITERSPVLSSGNSVDPGLPNRSGSSTTSTTATPANFGISRDLRGHPSFKEIPDVKECGSGLGQERIIGGKNVSHGAYPWMARIGYQNPAENRIEYFCGGTIISKRYILTAAHCTEGTGEYVPAQVRLGEHDTQEDLDCNTDLEQCSKAEDYTIEKVITHEKYNPNTKQNDITLIKVNKDIDFRTYFIRPVCLPFYKEYEVEPPRNTTRGIVAGWGRTHWNKAAGSTILQEVTLPISTNEDCQNVYNRRVMISEKQLCAGGIMGQDSCGGDSGGPLMFPYAVNKIPRMFQLGVVSFGPVQCGAGGLPGVYARTSEYLPWILDTIYANE